MDSIYLFSFFLLLYISNSLSQSFKPNGGRSRSLPIVDALITSLQRDRESHDGICLQATWDMLEGVTNNTLWATWIWDSIQLPMGSMYGNQAYLGNYDQCLKAVWPGNQRQPGFRSQYCLVEMKTPSVEESNEIRPFDNTEDYYRTPKKDRPSFNQHYIGVCLPSICSPPSVARISRHLLRLTHLPHGEVSVDPQNCVKAGEVNEYPTGFYVFWTVVLMLAATAIISTFFRSEDTKTNALATIAKSFCLRRNFRCLSVVGHDEVLVMHGMRFITAASIVFIHEAFVVLHCPIINALDAVKAMSSRFGQAALHTEIVVDTFFAMSGLLLVRGLMMGKQKNVLYTLVKRYFRLIAPLALCVFYLKFAGEYMNSGPMWRQYIRKETDYCKIFWWKTLLMANSDVATICYSVSWYISCDFQMAILGTFLFILFKRNRKLGVVTFASVAVALMVNLALTVYWKKLDVVPFNCRTVLMTRESTELNYIYFPSLARTGPYFVGMIMGYIITTYKPAKYRNIIGKKWSVIITLISLVIGFTMLSIGAIFMGRPYNALESAVVAAINRALWGVMVCALIGVCEYGSLNTIPSFLGWAGFVPLSKLSYCLYLLHPILLQVQKFATRTPAYFSWLNMASNWCGVIVFSTGLSLVLHLILEAPVNNILNAIFTVTFRVREQKGVKAEITNNGTKQCQEQNDHKAKKS